MHRADKRLYKATIINKREKKHSAGNAVQVSALHEHYVI